MSTPPRLAAPADLQALFALFGARRHAEMEALAASLAQRFPADGNVWKALSVARQVQGRDAVPALQQAIALLPRDAELRSNLGVLLSDAGRLEEAVDSFRLALAIKPDYADAHGNLGVALNRLGRHADAATSLTRALRLKPAFAEAEYNLGNAWLALARPADALLHYERALALRPAFADAQRRRASALIALGRPAEAADSMRAALAIRPGDTHFHAALGELELRLERFDAAAASYRQALEITPAVVSWHFDLGNALARAGRLEAAITAFGRALTLDPCAPAVLNNLGNAMAAAGEPEQALPHYRRALAVAPDDGQARPNLARALRQLGRFDEALDQFRLVVTQAPHDLAAHSDMLFIQNYLDYLPPGRMLEDARRFGAGAAAMARPLALRTRTDDGVLRIGLVSADLREHPVGYFAQSVLAALAREGQGRIALFVYANTPTRDAVSAAIAGHCEQWRDISAIDDAAAATCIAGDGIDILIDLSGHTASNRLPLFAWRPARLQLSWLGYCSTTGMDEIDYMLVDPHIAPAGAEALYVEKLWRLPDTFLCFTPPPKDIDVGPLPALAQGNITFGCFNKLSKVTDRVVALWSRVLLAVPGSRLLLKAPQLGAAAGAALVAARFAAHGIDAARLLFEGGSPRDAYLAAYRQVDIALDPFPYPGGTTSVEGLWMGVPVLTLAGARPLGRQGVSILRNLGLDEWIAEGEEDYVARAVTHAGQVAALAALRAGLRRRLLDSPLCDAPRFAGHLLAALTALGAAAGIAGINTRVGPA